MAAPVVNAESLKAIYLKEIESARRDLRALILNEKCAHIMLRLAWHDAGLYDLKTKKGGGPDGTIRFKKLDDQETNKGLKKAIELCEEVKEKHSKITYADLYQLAGVVAVELTGGPTIPFVAGRKDSDSTEYPTGGSPPSAEGVAYTDASKLRGDFTSIGLNDQDIVALSGGHILGQAQEGKPLKFDKSYFVGLQDKQPTQGSTQVLFKLLPDNVLVDDAEFHEYVKKYAKDEDAFFADYAASHKKLSELGFSDSIITPTTDAQSSSHSKITPTTVGVAVAAAIVILGFIFELHRRSKRV